jgi:2,4-dienoyl-CoA reductase-like NADH-dependent reductase (Old Yellow Enzyme family)
MIKLGCRDFLKDQVGLTIAEGAAVARALEEEGVCLIEISNGLPPIQTIPLGINSPEKEACFLPEARIIRQETAGPLCLVGGMRSLPVMEDIVQSGIADCISLCRPFIREPALVKRWMQGDRRPSECISCGGCFNPAEKGRHNIYCRQLKKKLTVRQYMIESDIL